MASTGTKTPAPPQSRAGRRRAERAQRARHTRLRMLGVVVGTVAAIVAVWAITGWPGVSLITGSQRGTGSPAAVTPSQQAPSAGPSATGTSRSTPSPAPSPTAGTPPQGSATGMAAALSPVSRFGLKVTSAPVVRTSNFAPLCGSGPRTAQKSLVAHVSRTLTGTPSGQKVTIVQSEAVFRSGGVKALLADAAGTFCAGIVDPPPGSPAGTVLLRNVADGLVIAYLVAPTGKSTAVYLEASSKDEEAISNIVAGAFPGLIADARSDSPALVAAGSTVPAIRQ